MAKKKTNIPENETEAQKLLRLGLARLNKLIKDIRLVGNLGVYKPSKQQTEDAFAAIKKEVELAYNNWINGKAEKTAEFKFSK